MGVGGSGRGEVVLGAACGVNAYKGCCDAERLGVMSGC